MTPIIATDLKQLHARKLQALQDKVNAHATYAEQVEYAKSSWSKKPAALFSPLKKQLAAMCSGNLRCVYCEDSMADEIEHMRPKDLYPEQAYAWGNYVLACGPCNGPKNNRFAVLGQPLELIDVTRGRNATVTAPQAGTYALIDPRVEDPMDFLWLDFRTWRYVPNSDDEQSEICLRANYTIEVLGLNKRDALVRGRKSAFSGYLSRLKHWQQMNDRHRDQERASFREDFRVERYRGVWLRMKHYRHETAALGEVAELIDTLPEVLDW